MMHKAWSSIEEVPFRFWRSSVKFQGHLALKIVEFDSNWAFPDCNSSLNSPMAMKCCTKLETEKERCPIVLQGHPSNFKVTWDKTSPILTQIGCFRTIGRSQLSNPSDLPCYFKNAHNRHTFLHNWPWISQWIKPISSELDITFHVSESQLSGYCDVISNLLWHHQQNENQASEIRGWSIKLFIIFIVIYGFVMSCKK